METSSELIEDVAAELGIVEPSLIEKDLHVVRVLFALTAYHSPYIKLVFAGGTCLSKTFPSLQRMSEDVDIKMLLTQQGQQLSKTQLRKELGCLKREIRRLLEKAGFSVSNETALNENHFIEWRLSYRAIFSAIEALRPNIKIELTLCTYARGYTHQAISSLIMDVTGQAPEITAFPCIDITQTAAEKLVSLLRRTAASLRGIEEWADDALIRHLYDLHIVNTEAQLGSEFVRITHQTAMNDAEQFSNRHPEFLTDTLGEIRLALDALNNQQGYRQQYSAFLGPLVYAQNKPDYDQGLSTLNSLSKQVWGNEIDLD